MHAAPIWRLPDRMRIAVGAASGWSNNHAMSRWLQKRSRGNRCDDAGGSGDGRGDAEALARAVRLRCVANQRQRHPLGVLCAEAADPALAEASFVALVTDAGAPPFVYPSAQRRGQHILDQALAANPSRSPAITKVLWERARRPGAYSPDVPDAGLWVLCALVQAGGLDRGMRWDVAFSIFRPDKLGFGGPDGELKACLVRAHWAAGADDGIYEEFLTQDHDEVAYALAASGRDHDIGADWRLAEHPSELVRRAYVEAIRGEGLPRLLRSDAAPPPIGAQIAAMTDTRPAAPVSTASARGGGLSEVTPRFEEVRADLCSMRWPFAASAPEGPSCGSPSRKPTGHTHKGAA